MLLRPSLRPLLPRVSFLFAALLPCVGSLAGRKAQGFALMRGAAHQKLLEEMRDGPPGCAGPTAAHALCSEMHVLMLGQVVDRIGELLEAGAGASV
jgi:hypothetical protein